MRGTNPELDDWIRRLAPRAVAYAVSLLGRADAAEDVVQDVLCRLLDHCEYDLLRDGEKLLFRSVTNACINRWARRREMVSLDAERGSEATLMETMAAENSCDPSAAAASHELLDAVDERLSDLPPMQRAAVELKALGHSLADIASMLDVSASNAGVLVHRGRKALRASLRPLLPEGLQ